MPCIGTRVSRASAGGTDAPLGRPITQQGVSPSVPSQMGSGAFEAARPLALRQAEPIPVGDDQERLVLDEEPVAARRGRRAPVLAGTKASRRQSRLNGR